MALSDVIVWLALVTGKMPRKLACGCYESTCPDCERRLIVRVLSCPGPGSLSHDASVGTQPVCELQKDCQNERT